jgi:hypothetical protein
MESLSNLKSMIDRSGVGGTHLLLLGGGWAGTLLMRAAMSGLSFCRFACFFFSSSSSLPQTDKYNFDSLLDHPYI